MHIARRVLFALTLITAPGFGPRAALGQSSADSADVAATVLRFHGALATGDSAAALAILAPDAVVLEAGTIETYEEYRTQHLAGDIAFARAVVAERGPLRVRVQGDVAWAISASTTVGTFRDRPINSSGAELVVLTRSADGWRIRAIHWSSRQRRP
jgi:ketosteroid isomerase-like protein